MLWTSRQCRDKDRHAGAREAGKWLWIARSRLCSLGFASCFSLVVAFAAFFFAMAGMMPDEAMPVKFFWRWAVALFVSRGPYPIFGFQ